MTPEEISAAGDALYEAEATREQVGLLTVAHPGMEMADAYRVQAAFCARKAAEGAKPIGWKIGLTSRAMQAALQIDVPDSGVLFDDMLFDTRATVPAGRFIAPRIEAEIAFMMKEGLAGDVSREDVLAATDYVAPSLEILDTRILRQDPASGQPRRICDTISDNAANAGIVLGAERHAPEAVDLRWVGAIVSRDGVVEETGLGAGVLNDPVQGIVWLAERLGQYGQGIEAGEIVLSGSFIRPVEAPPGSRFAADFGAFGKVEIAFG
ncbi:2-oxo-hepta-3-ene-1,7-dioic acid hydratase [Psychromarinibacter sp. C21-152]|uniref:2-oxo-hepta-3-ene-1,7-dioic acid hydratase n=1 Tax=Psychromarinibacter sediminicola TaxID=3033385 RepID=A0AAE3T8M8_9RHOB|nr:2-oxo-hepta-3-ene-1,7-dioic acid hydratase [Psychromarinibacter sediminicola]MDF0601417.1 2-oxo-hepta-3-ene-1,7-dioic acid hydratase [Psychromarinibacter sediminicola]